MEATHIRKAAQSGSLTAMAAGMDAVDPGILTEVAHWKHGANYDSGTDDEAEDKGENSGTQERINI